MINQALLRLSQKVKTNTALKNYQKVIKSSFKSAINHFGFIQYDLAVTLSIPRVLSLAVKKRINSHLYKGRNRKNIN